MTLKISVGGYYVEFGLWAFLFIGFIWYFSGDFLIGLLSYILFCIVASLLFELFK